jgi:hypothetical protein
MNALNAIQDFILMILMYALKEFLIVVNIMKVLTEYIGGMKILGNFRDDFRSGKHGPVRNNVKHFSQQMTGFPYLTGHLKIRACFSRLLKRKVFHTKRRKTLIAFFYINIFHPYNQIH